MKLINHKPVRAALALVLAAQLGVAGDALASAHKSAKRHRSRKTAGTVYKVKCATVSVRCQGTTGAQGPAGPNGKNGANGADGHSGANVVARPHATEVPLTTSPSGRNALMADNHWVQGPTEDDTILGGMTVSVPAQCHGGTGHILLGIYIDGQQVGFVSYHGTAGQTKSLSLRMQDLPAKGVSQDHLLSTRVTDNCSNNGDGHYVVQQLRFAVGAFS